MREAVSPAGLVRAWAVALLGSAGANELLRSALWELLAVPETFLPLTRPAVLLWTTVGVTGAAVAFALVARWTQSPAGTYRRLAAVALLVSWVPDALLPGSPRFPEATWQLAAGLAVLHVPPALLSVLLFPRWGLRTV
ncbi:MAG: hypothetical protein QN188_10910 [Armatimonadota bacterium]|nr:hypothetical protein [Armatimonadota bacterium]MDR5689639.1 hypothetical protein [Armatimonadota bacterium]MDR7386151.1 hypothetical protein [Armatimonadota bacterium]MDR7389435.1 hypothetical protein [Armatimonadota bacterium]MDR7392278.1 hypothetical protein [Armatimonadota bacterium]